MRRGQWAVQRERCHLAPGEGPAPGRDSARLTDVLPAVLRRLGVADTTWQQQLLDNWSELVGGAVARHARPGRLDQSTLCIFVRDTVWLHELRQVGTRTLLERIRLVPGCDRIRQIRLELDPDPRPAGG